MRASILSGIGAGFVLIIATACGGSAATNAPVASAPPAASTAAAAPTCSSGAAAGQQVGVANFSFQPGSLSVSSGSSVTWTNTDSATHTVTFDSGPDCGNVATGQSVTAQFPGPGTYSYHCKIHPSMKGTITVS